jgi:hypothetical protein
MQGTTIKIQNNISHQANTAFIHKLSNAILIHHPKIRRCVIEAAEKVGR